MAEVAVIGAGIFGSTTGLALAEAGHDVTLFDKNRTLLGGTSGASTNRLHIGAHYPRDLPTAIQSLESSILFRRKFPESVNDFFPNYYGLVTESSKTNFQQYGEFLNLLTDKARESTCPENLARLGLDESQLSGLWEIDEGVIDIDVLRTSLGKQLKQVKAELRLNEHVGEVHKNTPSGWELRTNRTKRRFDVVVRATYATDSIKIGVVENFRKLKKFQLTLNLVVECRDVFGLTLIDGDFLTVIPRGFQEQLIVYAPGPSVLRTAIGYSIPPNFQSIEKAALISAEKKILGRLKYWLPALSPVKVSGRLVAIRTLLPDVESTDARPSTVSQPAEDFFEVWSGKLDHAVQIAEKVTNFVSVGR